MDTAADTHVVGERLLEGDEGGDLGDEEPEAVPRQPEPRLPHQLEAERGRGAAEALLEGAAGDERAHDAQREVEAVGGEHGEGRHQAGLPLHPGPVAVQAEADTASIDPGQEDRGEVTFVHLAGVVREQPVLHVLQREGVQQQDVGDGDRPDQADNMDFDHRD